MFDDDTAYDALDDLKESVNIMSEMEKYFDEVIQTDYVGYEEGHYVLLSAAVIDSAINGISYRCDDRYIEWLTTLNIFNFNPLKQKAVGAIESVLSDHSELRELWEENEELYTVWKNDKLEL